MQRILVYTVGPLTTSQKGKRYILTVQCSLTKWAEAYAILNQHATMCTRVLVKNWVRRYVAQDSVQSNQ